MDRQIEPTNTEKIKIRKAMQPVISQMVVKELVAKIEELNQTVKKLDKDLPEVTKVKGQVEITNQKDTQKVEVINQEKVKFPETQKVEITNQKEVQKVEVTNQQEINITEKIIEFPELQNIQGNVTATNLPIGDGEQADSRKANPTNYLVVRLTDGQQFYRASGGGSSVQSTRQGDHLFLREEYSYTTISGIQVPTTIEKWTDNTKVTETYEYDGNANPIKKFRSIEPL